MRNARQPIVDSLRDCQLQSGYFCRPRRSPPPPPSSSSSSSIFELSYTWSMCWLIWPQTLPSSFVYLQSFQNLSKTTLKAVDRDCAVTIDSGRTFHRSATRTTDRTKILSALPWWRALNVRTATLKMTRSGMRCQCRLTNIVHLWQDRSVADYKTDARLHAYIDWWWLPTRLIGIRWTDEPVEHNVWLLQIENSMTHLSSADASHTHAHTHSHITPLQSNWAGIARPSC